MNISGLEKLTVTDYPGYVACIIFTQGCNFYCAFCQNSALIPIKKGDLNEKEIFDYLEKRKKILDGVVITGGEPLLQRDIKEFIIKIKEMGYKVKLDTNGSNPFKLKELLEENLIDYVAMDIKHDKESYSLITGNSVYNYKSIETSIELIENSNIDYEFRTTIVKEYHDLSSIANICQLINSESKYYLQNFVNSELVPDQDLHGFSDSELKNMEQKLNEKYPNVKIRGL